MMFNRYEAKMRAKESMRNTQPSYILVTLIYFLLTNFLVSMVMYFLPNPIQKVQELLIMGYQDVGQVFQYVYAQMAPVLPVYIGVSIVLNLYNIVMGFGYTSYALRLARNEQPGYAHLLDGFAKIWRVLWKTILESIFVFLWGLPFMVAGGIALAIVIIQEMYGLLALYWFLIMAALVVMAMRGYSYQLSSYFMLDDPDCTAREAITRSKRAMKGWRWEAFVLDMSFIGWLLLAMVISGIVGYFVPILGTIAAGVFSLWLTPYMNATAANFYDSVTGGLQNGSGDYAGPSYDYRSSDGPQPF